MYAIINEQHVDSLYKKKSVNFCLYFNRKLNYTIKNKVVFITFPPPCLFVRYRTLNTISDLKY